MHDATFGCRTRHGGAAFFQLHSFKGIVTASCVIRGLETAVSILVLTAAFQFDRKVLVILVQ